MSIIFTSIFSIIGYIILFVGIFFTKSFTDKLGCRKPYKPAILVNIIVIIIMFIVGILLNNLVIGYLMSINAEIYVLTYFGVINTVISILINLIVYTVLINAFYKIGLDKSVFISLAVVSIQVFMRTIVATLLGIIFNLTTGGYISFSLYSLI